MAQLKIADSPVDLVQMAQDKLMADRGQGRKVYIETYGCQMNIADSELMGGVLLRQGYKAARDLDEADIILVNTCAVREKAEERVMGRLATLNGYKNRRPEVLLGVCGCMAEHLRERLTEAAPYVDLVIGPDAYRRLPDLIDSASAEAADPVIDVRLDRKETYEGISPVRQEGIRGWVTIQRGCDKFCSFCIVPFTRGRERGVPPREVLRQVRELAERGVPEVTLLGQTVNSYFYEDVDFADLLKAVAQVEGIKRVRFTSPYPVDFTPKLIETMASEPKISKYIHFPVQSGSTPMLKRMRRGYTAEEYMDLVRQLRAAMPDLAMSTDIIVGFCAETEEEFQKTLDLVREVRFDFSYMFKYSERDHTFASKKMPDDIPEEVKGRRLRDLIALQEEISYEVMQALVGQTVEVLIEGDSRRSDQDWVGRTDTFKTTIFPKVEGTEPGQVVPVKIRHANAHTLLGDIAWNC
jgi:tRNA-2-methylthio-N6-dimethylallyladenosine synthase